MDVPEEMPQCSVGLATQDICHKLIYCRKAGIIAADELSLKDTKVLEWRAEISMVLYATTMKNCSSRATKVCRRTVVIHSIYTNITSQVCFYVMFSKYN